MVGMPATRATSREEGTRMLENARGPLIGLAVASWVLAAIFTTAILRTKVMPQTRRAFKRIAWVYTGVVAVIQLIVLAKAHAGVILPGWFYAGIFGLLIPWVIALHAAGIDKEAYRQTHQ